MCERSLVHFCECGCTWAVVQGWFYKKRRLLSRGFCEKRGFSERGSGAPRVGESDGGERGGRSIYVSIYVGGESGEGLRARGVGVTGWGGFR